LKSVTPDGTLLPLLDETERDQVSAGNARQLFKL